MIIIQCLIKGVLSFGLNIVNKRNSGVIASHRRSNPFTSFSGLLRPFRYALGPRNDVLQTLNVSATELFHESIDRANFDGVHFATHGKHGDAVDC